MAKRRAVRPRRDHRPLLGPTIGGYLIDMARAGHWIFLVNVPIGIIAAMVIPRVIQEPGFEPDRKPGSI